MTVDIADSPEAPQPDRRWVRLQAWKESEGLLSTQYRVRIHKGLHFKIKLFVCIES